MPAASRSKKIPTPRPKPSPPTRRCSRFSPTHAAAHINLGTLYYNRQDFALAEKHYRQAIEADPRYALAYFDLGNVLDETGRVQEAIQTYKTALQLAPTYADAHYNLALAFEKIREPRKALKHWQAYVKLDTTGPWSVHARNQIKRILQADDAEAGSLARGSAAYAVIPVLGVDATRQFISRHRELSFRRSEGLAAGQPDRARARPPRPAGEEPRIRNARRDDGLSSEISASLNAFAVRQC